MFSPKQSLSGQEQFPLISAVLFFKIFEKHFPCFTHHIVCSEGEIQDDGEGTISPSVAVLQWSPFERSVFVAGLP